MFHLYRHWSTNAPVWKELNETSERAAELAAMLPGPSDSDAVALTIIRLQSMYNLAAEDIYDGVIRGHRWVVEHIRTRAIALDTCKKNLKYPLFAPVVVYVSHL